MKNLENYGVLEIGKEVLNINGGCGQFRASDADAGGSGSGSWWCVYCWIDNYYE